MLERRNEIGDFDQKILAKLGCYVYALIDPRDGRIFYVGKGGGEVGKGNDRLFDHFHEAERSIGHLESGGNVSEKIRRILDIWRNGYSVDWRVLKYGLPDSESAFQVESGIINALRDQITNKQDGHHGGLATAEDVYKWGAEPVNPGTSYSGVFLFQIHKALAEGKSPYDATRMWWRIAKHWRSGASAPVLAVGLERDLSVIVIEIDGQGWCRGVGQLANRWSFSGTIIENHELLNKNFKAVKKPVMGHILRGNFVVVSFNGRGGAKLLRGGDAQVNLGESGT